MGNIMMNMNVKLKKKIYLIVIITFMIIFTNHFLKLNGTKRNIIYPRDIFTDTNDSLIFTPKCRIPNLAPFNDDVQSFFYQKPYISCNDKELLTYVERTDKVTLNVNQTLLDSYSWFTISCCYSVVSRDIISDDPDNKIMVSECIPFGKSVVLRDNIIQVTCSTFLRTVYTNVHFAFGDDTNQIGKPNLKDDVDPPSVLLIGIDSISRLNLQRTMPYTYNFLERTDWINLKGYNKIADNTFPNVLAFLTGMNDTYAEETCGPFSSRCLDDCDFIWKRFNKQGYATLYAEDWSKFGTFNYYRKGFCKQPTDFYFRPYFLAADKLPARSTLNGISYCSGPETSGERILNAIHDFSNAFNNKPTFGFFWMNTFSHNNINDPTMMDTRVYSFLEKMITDASYQNTIVIFLSDHGFRFGKIRYTFAGWLEERLPFIYIRLPEKFRQKYPLAVKNVRRHSDSLTNPYNLFATFEHILYMNDNSYKPKGSVACPNCKSLFSEPDDKSCEEASIEKHWCSCTQYERLSFKDPLVSQVANFVLKELKKVINSFGEISRKCSDYVLYKITSSSISPPSTNSNNEVTRNVLVTFETFPEAAFEATVTVHYNCDKTSHKLSLSSDISRLDRYGGKVSCLGNSPLQKYCYCPKLMTIFQTYFCNDFYCIHI